MSELGGGDLLTPTGKQFVEFSPATNLANGGKSLLSVSAELTSATLKVTSKDYGGRARLFAYFIFPDGSELPAIVVDGADDYLATVPSCLAAQGVTVLAFATLPVDDDCDDIADAWEREVGQLSDISEDAEPGPGGPHVGDGYTAHDEYRGFHYVVQAPSQGQTVAWTRTDPKMAKDVFWLDADNFGLAPRVDEILGRQHPALKLYQVNAQQANRNSNVDTDSSWVNPLSSNSFTEAYDRKAFALPFQSSALPPRVLGRSNGFTMNGRPVLFSSSNIADQLLDRNIPFDFVLSWTLAHEAGHRFGLLHPERDNCGKISPCRLVTAPNPLLTLGLDEFAIVPNDNTSLYLKLPHYIDQRPQPVPLTRLEDPKDKGFVKIGAAIEEPVSIVKQSTDTILLQHVFSLRFSPRIITASTSIGVYTQIDSLMDWSFNVNRTNASLIQFSADQLNQICTHGKCGQQ